MRLRFVLRAGTANRYRLTATLPMRQAFAAAPRFQANLLQPLAMSIVRQPFKTKDIVGDFELFGGVMP